VALYFPSLVRAFGDCSWQRPADNLLLLSFLQILCPEVDYIHKHCIYIYLHWLLIVLGMCCTGSIEAQQKYDLRCPFFNALKTLLYDFLIFNNIMTIYVHIYMLTKYKKQHHREMKTTTNCLHHLRLLCHLQKMMCCRMIRYVLDVQQSFDP